MIDKKLFVAKAQGFIIAFEKMGKDERVANPSGTYAEAYNGLRSAVIELLPEFEPIMPPAVQLLPGFTSGSYVSAVPFAEINTYCEQISQMLTGIDE